MMAPGGDLLLLFGASLLGSAHCVGMCGPYVAGCTQLYIPATSTAPARTGLRLLFILGRLAVYCGIGLCAGAFGQVFLALAATAGLGGSVSVVAGLLALLFGLSLVGWLPDPARLVARAGLDGVMRAGRQRLRGSPALLVAPALGALQGLLPCAMVYAAASRAAVAGNATGGALTMLVFGLGTVPVNYLLTLVPRQILLRVRTQRLAGVLLALLGTLLILRGLAGFGLLPSTALW